MRTVSASIGKIVFQSEPVTILPAEDGTGRIRHWQMRNIAGEEQPTVLRERIVVNDPAAMCSAALLGLGVAMIATPDAGPARA